MSSGMINHDQSEPHIWGSIIVMVVVFILLLATVFGSYFYFNTSLTQELNKKDDTGEPRSLKRQRVYESEFLHSLKWENKRLGIVHIPIDLAMEKVIKRYNYSSR